MKPDLDEAPDEIYDWIQQGQQRWEKMSIDTEQTEKQGITDTSSFAALSSQSPPPTREAAEGDIYEVEDTSNLPDDAKSDTRLVFTSNTDDVFLSVSVADDNRARYRGLSYKQQLEDNYGMLFDWGKMDINSLVMRNMSFSIDMIFLDKEGYVNKTYEQVEPDDTESKKGICQYAIEAPAGFVDAKNIDTSYRVFVETETGNERPQVIETSISKQNDVVYVDRVSEAPEDVIVHVSPESKEMYYTKNDMTEKAEIADKYLDNTGLSEDDFVPNQDVKAVVDTVLEFIDEHGLLDPDNQQEGATRANQLQNYAEDDEPMPYEYWEEIKNYHARHRAQGSHECDESSLPAEAEEVNQNKFEPCLFDNGYFSDQTWGSDAGYDQAKKIVNAVEDADIE